MKEESSQIAFLDEVTTTSDNISYTIANALKNIWGFNSVIIVEDAGVPTTEPYTLSRLTGTVSFETADAGRVITVSGDYVLLSTVAEAKAWGLDVAIDMLDETVFQDSSRAFKPGLITGSASIGKFYTLDKYFVDAILAGTTKVIEFYADAAEPPIVVYGIISADGISSAVESLIEESVSIQITQRMILEV